MNNLIGLEQWEFLDCYRSSTRSKRDKGQSNLSFFQNGMFGKNYIHATKYLSTDCGNMGGQWVYQLSGFSQFDKHFIL